MKVLHVITGLATGGAERALYNLLAGGLAQSFETAVLSLRDEGSIGGQIRELGVPLYGLRMSRGLPTPGTVSGLRQVVREFEPDVIQGWMYHGNLAASLAARLAPKRPVVAWNIRQSLYGLKAEKPMTRQVIRANRLGSGGPRVIIYNSRLSRSQHETFGFRSARAVVIPNGFDLAQLGGDPVIKAAVRAELGLAEKSVVIGHVARLHPMKDHAALLRAAVRVVRENPSVRFLLAGREVSPNNPALAGIVPSELLGRFIFAGERSDPHRLMQAMDVLVTSSAWGEAFPNVLGEAMACGIPCVATDVGDSADIVGATGIVVPPADPQALTYGLETIVRKSGEERRALGRAAREHIRAHYGLYSVVKQYTEMYERLGYEKRG
jgi:glycosyltransferase involved in cell wall biosynthesis